MKFAHLADCHLGGWRQPELRQLNLLCFQEAIDRCVKEKVNFVIIAGDLFDTAYPPVEILEEAVFQLKKLKDSRISCYIVAGSHDYSASGKTFLGVLEKAGFCKNIYCSEDTDRGVYLNPTLHENVALYGYPGKKAGLEVNELRNIKLQESPFFKIFVLHTSIKDAVKNIPIESVQEDCLPKADYYALGHLHINYNKNRFVYAGPLFPNNFEELEELKGGSFYIVETEPFEAIKIELKPKKIEIVHKEITNALTATLDIVKELKEKNLNDKIILLRIFGKLEQGKVSDIRFDEIENYIRENNGVVMLRNISKLKTEETEIDFEIEDMDKLEEEVINKYSKDNPSGFNSFIFPLIHALSIDKKEGETSETFNTRLFSELNKILNVEC